MNKTLPVIELLIDGEETLVSAVSIVHSPAVESNFLAFKREEDKIMFSLNDERKELLGIAMLPDVKIFRKHKDGDYFCFFSKETIRKIAQNFFKNGFANNMNVEHSNVDADSYVFQSYIVDDEKGLLSPKGMEAPDGAWIIGVKVNSDDLWNDIKDGKRQGFSVEGFFQMVDTKRSIEMEEEVSDEAIYKVLEEYSKALKRIR